MKKKEEKKKGGILRFVIVKTLTIAVPLAVNKAAEVAEKMLAPEQGDGLRVISGAGKRAVVWKI
ncbi:hypothetical protein FACS189490_10240 [Clostridia bacterium]|nr:hypothetical protein FACS189490_10240 [Clostridia bacterium]